MLKASNSDHFTCSCPTCGELIIFSREHTYTHDKVACMNCNKAFTYFQLNPSEHQEEDPDISF